MKKEKKKKEKQKLPNLLRTDFSDTADWLVAGCEWGTYSRFQEPRMDPNQHQWGLSRLLSRGVLGGEGWVLVDGLTYSYPT
ncbi:hypothetical protein F9C07_2569 [Aspergillus flavus]|uniref:Uncharacterized protein n=1 Tax=Aspergillus flavus (strain ATCC 200026 / FGSC A1120 / IAM 13836 / NRRL 3357 / JCM 12722 / SRRC 167) TaxID=332952 RepID=A0A7U2MF46_ASPFN|nr:hypothetical protein F9C07_2569 [Aspergillus flavus]